MPFTFLHACGLLILIDYSFHFYLHNINKWKNYFWRCIKIIVNLIYLSHPSLEEIMWFVLCLKYKCHQLTNSQRINSLTFGGKRISLFNKKILLLELFRQEWEKERKYEDDKKENCKLQLLGMKNVFEFNMIILFEIEDKYNEEKVCHVS